MAAHPNSRPRTEDLTVSSGGFSADLLAVIQQAAARASHAGDHGPTVSISESDEEDDHASQKPLVPDDLTVGESGGFSAALLAVIQDAAVRAAQAGGLPNEAQTANTPESDDEDDRTRRKRITDRTRRSKLNEKYQELCDVLNIPRNCKRQKLQVLSLALDQLKKAKSMGFIPVPDSGPGRKLTPMELRQLRPAQFEPQPLREEAPVPSVPSNQPPADDGEELPVPEISGLDGLDILATTAGEQTVCPCEPENELFPNPSHVFALLGQYPHPRVAASGGSDIFSALPSGTFDGYATGSLKPFTDYTFPGAASFDGLVPPLIPRHPLGLVEDA